MTKLFSMKSLAFAGAAAFALTLAAAPQAEAEEVKLPTISGTLEKLYVNAPEEDQEFIETDDGQVIYYAVAKANKTIQDKNFTAIADEKLGYYNFSKYAGKENILYISMDGKAETATHVAISAAPKLKAKYNVKDGLKITIDNQEAVITSGEAIRPLKEAGIVP